MRFRLKLVGLPELRAKVDRFRDQVEDAMAISLEAAALPLENAWKDKISNFYNDAGYVGPDGKRGLVETGTFLRSIHHERISSREVAVGTDIVDPPYPKYLEFGTSRMAPKPTARPALDESAPRMRSEFRASMAALMGSIGR